MILKYNKRSTITTLWGVYFQNFSFFGNTFGENQDLISYRYQVSGIMDQGTGNREQGSGKREQETVN